MTGPCACGEVKPNKEQAIEELLYTPSNPPLEEPLLAPNPDRLCMFPIYYPQIWEMYKKNLAGRIWTEDDLLDLKLADGTIMIRGVAQAMHALGKMMSFLVVRQITATAQCMLTVTEELVSTQMMKYVISLSRESTVDIEDGRRSCFALIPNPSRSDHCLAGVFLHLVLIFRSIPTGYLSSLSRRAEIARVPSSDPSLLFGFGSQEAQTQSLLSILRCYSASVRRRRKDCIVASLVPSLLSDFVALREEQRLHESLLPPLSHCLAPSQEV
ncbi:hypothetical protein IEQ34_009397 [Dendrobium chrysotoxum]|uniref:Uncharacterized protein n=1 Tax=Dendrobium chrysotoxum TaxID=161865 RepID=A0AAV7H1Y0_DENCH|nr:hypothetical protein IEQ34_009397 [Dendrobium chrysotoxum]